MRTFIKKIVMPEFVEMPKDFWQVIKCEGCGNTVKHCISEWYTIENLVESYDASMEHSQTTPLWATPFWTTSTFLVCPLCHTVHNWTPELIEKLRPYADTFKKYRGYSTMVNVVSAILLNCIPTVNGFKLKSNADGNTQEVDFTIEWDDEISELSKCLLMQINAKDVIRHIKSIEFDREIDINDYYTAYVPNAWTVNTQPDDPSPCYQYNALYRGVLPDYQSPEDCDNCNENDGNDAE